MAFKKLHSLLIRSFLPPFAITLFVSVFLFFLVEIVITYLDDFIGKGLGFWTLAELFSLAWVTIIPQCIPLAVLLASIMTIGSLAENYELAAMKSAGLSLFNIIRPLFVTILILGLFTFVFNNYIIPKVTLKFSTLLYDIRSAKPAMNIKEGIFYNKINGDSYTLRVGKKDKKNQGIQNVIIYDHSARMGNNIQLYADSGEMNTTPDTNYLVIKLKNGNRYEEMIPENNHRMAKPLSQLNFKEMTVNIELTDFKLKHTDEKLFGGHYEMMNVWQIDREIDTFEVRLNHKYRGLQDQAKNYFFYRTINYVKAQHKDTVNIKKFYAGMNATEFSKSIDNALNIARSSSAFIDSVVEGTKNELFSETQYKIGWHEKINISFAC
ncbi:MAG: LptF/LptG family permease, partial [Bacteroidia bacterium]